jgi:hypothetical protein
MENDANNLEKTHNDLDTNDGKRSVTPVNGKSKESKIIWSPDNEKILIEWCDVAQCYKWLNLRCHSKLSSTHAWFTIPAITLSTITGTASFAQSTLPPELQGYAPAVIGTINIFVGILTTIQQYLKISEKNESHRVSAISWDKFARNIRIELAKTPQERDGAGHFIKAARQEFDRLMETSPAIDDTTIKEFYNKFQGEPNTKKRERFNQLKKPDICDTIISAEETRNRWFEEDPDAGDDIDISAVKERDNFIVMQQKLLIARDEEIRKQHQQQEDAEIARLQEIEDTARRIKEEEDEYNLHVEKIISYINGYQEVYNRKPDSDDIINNFKDQIDNDVLNKFTSGYMS